MTANNNDATRIISDDNQSVSTDNTAFINETPDEKASVKKQTSKGKTIGSGNIAAAGIGLAVGAAGGASVGMNATTTPNDEIELADAPESDVVLDTEVTDVTSDIETDIPTDNDVVEDKPTDVANDITDTNTATSVNVEVNITSDSNGQLHVTGPNPAEVAAMDPNAIIRDAGQQMHENAVNMTENVVTPVEPVAPENLDMVDNTVPQAHVNDSMSFSEAFAAARAEVGPGGSFTWHGQVYGTYYENEWNQMTPDEQHDFQMAAINADHSDYTPQPSDNLYADTKTTVDEPVEPTENDVVYVDPEPVSDDEVRILGLGLVEDEMGNSHEAAIVDFSGNQAMIIDSDDDLVYDVISADLDGDGVISDAEIDNSFGEYGVTVDGVSEQYQQQLAIEEQFEQDTLAQNDMNVDDFNNNIDVSDFA